MVILIHIVSWYKHVHGRSIVYEGMFLNLNYLLPRQIGKMPIISMEGNEEALSTSAALPDI